MLNKAPADWFRVAELAPGVWGIGEFGHYEEVLSFLLTGDDEAVLIDTGLGFFSMKALVQELTDLPCRVINTHSHFDHIGSNAEFAEVALFDHPLSHKYAHEGVGADELAYWITPKQFTVPRPPLPEPYTIQPFPHARYFQAGDTVSLAPYTLEILHTPGHSEDSVSFYDAARGILFPGDLFYDGPIYIEGGDGWAKYRRSVSQMTALPDLQRIFTSHNAFEFSLAQLAELQRAVAAIEDDDLTATVELSGRMSLVPE